MALSAPSFKNWSNQDAQRLFKQWDSIRDKNRAQLQGFNDDYYQNTLRYQPLLDALKPVNRRLTKIKDLSKTIAENTMSNLQRLDKGKKLDALAEIIKQVQNLGDADAANEIKHHLFDDNTNAQGFFDKIYLQRNQTSSTSDPNQFKQLMSMIDEDEINTVLSLVLSTEVYRESMEDIINRTAEYEMDFEGTQEPDLNEFPYNQPPTAYGPIMGPPPPYSPPPSYSDVVGPPPPYSLPPSYSGISPPPSYSDITPPPSYSSLYPPRVPPPYTGPRVDPRVPPPYPADVPLFELPQSWGSIEEGIRTPYASYESPIGVPPSSPVPESLKVSGIVDKIVASYSLARMTLPLDIANMLRDEQVRDEIMELIGKRLNESALNLTDMKEIDRVRLLDMMMRDLVGNNERRFNVINKFQKLAQDKVINVISMMKSIDAQLSFLVADNGYPNDYVRIPFQVRGAKLRASGKAGASLSITPEGEWELFGKRTSFPDPLHIKVGNNEYVLTNGLMRLILSNNPEIYTNYVDNTDRNLYLRIAADNLDIELNKIENNKIDRISTLMGSVALEEIARENKTPTGEGYERSKKLRSEIYQLERKMAKRGEKKKRVAKAKAKKREEELAPLVDVLKDIAGEAKEIKHHAKKIKKQTKPKTSSKKGKGEFSNSMAFQANTRKRDRAQATKQVKEGITFGHGMPTMSKGLKNRMVLIKGTMDAGNNGKKVQAELKKLEKKLK